MTQPGSDTRKAKEGMRGIRRATFIVIIATLFFCSISANAKDRGVETRIAWLQEQLSHWNYVCKRGHRKPQKYACAARTWTQRELREAQKEKWERDWAAPPEPYLSIARCEQHSEHGMWGVQWDAYSQSYEGAYGYLHSTWRENRSAWMAKTANLATPREQLIVAQRLHARLGWKPWPACHIRLGLPDHG